MTNDVRVFATGNTLTLLCNEYVAQFPDGSRVTMYAVAPKEPADELAAALRQGRELWAKRQARATAG